MKIILAIIIFSLIILFHEFGHFIFAKKCGVRVNQFCLGLGPTILSWGKGETKYCLNLLPFGGACVMEGEDEGSDDERAFNNKTAWQRFQIVFAGPFFNFIMAFVLAVVYIACVGVTKPVIAGVLDGYSAQAAGLQEGDTIVKLDGYRVHFYQEISIYTYFHTGEDVTVTYIRNGQKESTVLSPIYNEEEGRYLLGIAGAVERANLNPLETVCYGAYEVKYQIYITIQSLRMLFTGALGLDDMSGPVGVVTTIGDVYDASVSSGAFYVFVNLLSIAILLSANLGVMNLLPLPALDGGRILLIIVEVVRRKRIDPDLEGKINLAGFGILMLLMVVVMYNDIAKLFH